MKIFNKKPVKQSIALYLLFFLTISFASAQRGSLLGVVVDKTTEENISFATVAIMKAGEEAAFTGSVSDENGRFLIQDLPNGTYNMVVSFIGFNSGAISNITLSSGNKVMDLGCIELEPKTIGIESVEVNAAARTAANRIDRRTYRAADFETGRGRNSG